MSVWVGFRRWRWWWQTLAWAVAWPVPLALWAAARPKEQRLGPVLLAAASLVVWVAAAGAGAEGRPDQRANGGQVQETTTSSTSPPETEGDTALARLRVAPEGFRTGYSRDLFPHWIDADGDRCDTREEVLIAESRSPAQVDPYGCKVTAGDWVSFYDGLTFDDPSELDIDHVVALGEAWDSGASAWDEGRRRAFANDLDRPEALRAVSASSNRSKSDLDPAQWKPSRESAWCQYAKDWVSVKVAWDLSADEDEVADLRVMLSTC
jgi:hypothetical protein